MHAAYEEDETMEAARRRYFEANAFGDDGGYGDAWVSFKLGPLPLPFPNTASRVRAVRYHDLHHVLTGYDTDPLGEFEIAAWELGAGCKGFVAAWVLNLSGLAAGALCAPRRVFAAFVRGRRSRSLYGESFEPLLSVRVGEARRRYVAGPSSCRPADLALFLATVALGVLVGLTLTAVFLPLVPVGLIASALRAPRVARPE